MRFAQSIAVAVALLSTPFAHAANGLQGTYILEATAGCVKLGNGH